MELKDIITIVFTTISTIISIIALVKSFRRDTFSKDTYYQQQRGKVTAYIESRNNKFYIIIKNVGNSLAEDISVDFNPKLSSILHPDINCFKPLLTDYKDYTLTPNQEIQEVYDITKYQFRIFSVTIKYNTLGKSETEHYKLDTYYLDCYKEIT